MRKSFLIIAAAAMLASCWETEKIGKDYVNDENPTVIGFNTVSEKATRATASETDLEYYHNSFNVYSTKTSNNVTDATPEVVFDGNLEADLISFDSTRMAPNNWTYSPYRYWDKQATYAFVAVAPNSKIVKYSKSENVADNAGTFVTTNTTGYTLVGQNLQTSDAPADAEIRKGFTGANGGDTDIMTSGKITRNGANPAEDVNLEFHHILAKLNIAIAKDPTFDNVKVIIRKVQVVGLDDNGTYYEGTSDTESAWTSSKVNDDYKLLWENANGKELPGSTDEANGKKLYFCSAHFEYYNDSIEKSAEMIQRYDEVKYSLYSVDFDPDTKEFSNVEMVYDAASDSINQSVTLPRVSPDGRYILFAQAAFGCFHVWHADADIFMMDLQTKEVQKLDAVNSDRSESYPSWSSNGRWIMVDSRRDDGNYTRPYIAYFDKNGKAHKPFMLPQKDPNFYTFYLRSFNRPEFMIEPVTISPQEFATKAKEDAIPAKYADR